MNPYRKAIAFVLRFAAVGLILLPLILFGLDFFAAKARQITAIAPTTFEQGLKVSSVVAGLILLFTSGSIARKVTEDLDE